MLQYSNEIRRIFEWFYENGYITSRDGNACVKVAGNSFYVTASGIRKQSIVDLDCIMVNNNGEPTDSAERTGLKPSIETMAHILALNETNKIASIHVHSPNTVALFNAIDGDQFDQLEETIREDWPELFRYTKLGKTVPYLPPGSDDLHKAIKESFVGGSDIIVLDQHGVIAVGDSLEHCREHIHRLEHISEIILKRSLMANIIKLRWGADGQR